MNRTVNYDLCQYEADDKTSYLVNYNNDMLKIDTAIKGAKDAADAAQAKADTADGKADINAGSISTLNTQINGAQGLAADVSALEGSVNTINSLIGNGEPTTQDKTLIGAINELAAEIPQGGIDADEVDYDNTSSGLTATNVQSAIDEVNAKIPQGGNVEADDVVYDNTSSGLTATNVQSAIDEVAAKSLDITMGGAPASLSVVAAESSASSVGTTIFTATEAGNYILNVIGFHSQNTNFILKHSSDLTDQIYLGSVVAASIVIALAANETVGLVVGGSSSTTMSNYKLNVIKL